MPEFTYPTLTSPQNSQVKNLVKLRQRRQRDRQGLMLIDGVRALTLAIKTGFQIKTLFFDEARLDMALLTLAQLANIDLQPVTSAIFQKIGYGDNPDGHVGVTAQPDLSLQKLPSGGDEGLYVVAEGLEKPGNLGAILRSADAAGVTGLIISDSQTDIYNPNVIRASQGTFFTVPLVVTETLLAIRWLHENKVRILAASPTGQQLYTECDMRGSIALVIGAEHVGLTDIWLNETSIYIPMHGQIDSLNVAQSATLLMFEAVRQRTR